MRIKMYIQIRLQQSCTQFMLRLNTSMQEVNTAFSPDHPVLNCYTLWQCRRRKWHLLLRPVYESSFWTSKAVYETSHNRGSVRLSVRRDARSSRRHLTKLIKSGRVAGLQSATERRSTYAAGDVPATRPHHDKRPAN